MSRAQVDELLSSLSGCEAYIVAAFAPVGANRGTVALAGELPHAVENIAAVGKPVALVALGSPYLLRNFPSVTAYLATFSNVHPSELAAVRALWGEIAIGGHLPVSIPGMAKLGDGIATQAKVIEFLAYDPENSSSICSCLRFARENARSVRETISSEMWAQINSMYLQIQSQRSMPEPERLLDAFREIRLGCHLFCVPSSICLVEACAEHGLARRYPVACFRVTCVKGTWRAPWSSAMIATGTCGPG